MKALGRVDALEAAFPEETISPVQLVQRNKKKKGLRASTQNKLEKITSNNKELDW